MIYTTMA